MKYLTYFAKFFVVLAIALSVYDIALLGYAYITSAQAVEDSLAAISMIVAEENCLSTDTEGTPSKYDSAQTLLAQNCPLWLTYNREPFAGMISGSPTNPSQVELNTAIANIDERWAINLTSPTNTQLNDAGGDNNLYSYTTCPQRGEPITVTLRANINVHIFIFGMPEWGNLSIPIQRDITVIGMKFYKGKDA